MGATWKKARTVYTTVSAGEASSGLVTLSVNDKATAEYPSGDFLSITEIKTSAGVQKVGFKTTKNLNSGLVTHANEGTFAFATNDILVSEIIFI